MNGAFTSTQNNSVLVDREMASELISWNNVFITLKESWFLLLALFGYFALKTYNDYLDREE